MGHLQVNSCVNNIVQVLWELPRSQSPVADVDDVVYDVVYVVDDENDAVSDVRLDRLEDVGDVEDVVIWTMM